ncbi:uncharacterized protein BDW43DRAFT_308529 [Aspergillus alliaceus]|uniref:uncharacterized protein n=1 Tax=Petromyces alliaceus TaxID=209559 RepID=UPI0012A533E3|nr:uncharacterized protein BDW43DRAFT_308529 [Aspergillus alliaceus]KAB8236265.1 hypothetical protein BDW43DRAFT_308529 [Aspergillus alliaceus]
MSLVDAIGVISGALTIVGFGIDNFGESSTSVSIIKVAVTLDGTGGTTDAGGDLPDVRIWNDLGSFVGMKADPDHVNNGNLSEISIDHGSQGVYTLFSTNSDAICVAWVTTTWSDDRGGNQYAVSGDYGKECGANWFASNMYNNSEQDHLPNCFWINADGDQPSTGKCNGIDFGVRDEEDPNTIKYYVKNKRDAPVRARQQKRRPAWADSDLIISDSKHHSAKSLDPLRVLQREWFKACFDFGSQTVTNSETVTTMSTDDAGAAGRYTRVLD